MIGCDLVLTTILEILKRPVVCQFVKRAGVVTDPGDLSNDLLLTAQQEAAMASRDHTDAALCEFVSFKFYQN